MNTSMFLAKLFGFLMVLISLNIFFCARHFKAYAKHMLETPGVGSLISMLNVIFGLLLVLFHNVWIDDWTVVVTILCWVVLVRGLYGFFFHEKMAKIAKKLIKSKTGLYIAAVVEIVIGGFLLFMAYMQ